MPPEQLPPEEDNVELEAIVTNGMKANESLDNVDANTEASAVKLNEIEQNQEAQLMQSMKSTKAMIDTIAPSLQAQERMSNIFSSLMTNLEGPDGPQGEKGDKGDKGETGEQGPQGEKGETGEQGPSGADGIDGVDGEMGPAGADGKDGKDGKNGKDGKDADSKTIIKETTTIVREKLGEEVSKRLDQNIQSVERRISASKTVSLSELDDVDLTSATLVDGKYVIGGSGDSLPDQTGNNGKFLTTDGTDPSWATLAGGGDMAAAVYDPQAIAADAFARTNHTGTQPAATISDFDTEVANNSAVTANTAKVTNATHTGDVTGATALTIANGAVTAAKTSAGVQTSLGKADTALQNVVLDTTPELGGDLDALDNAINNVEVLNFNTTPAEPTYTEGNVYWDATDKTLIVEQGVDNVRLQVGQENYIRVRNSTGSTITNGQVVYVSGVTGNRPNITLARADVAATAEEIGIATHDIENNTDGLVTVSGVVRGVDTSSFTANQTVYLSAATAGALTTTAPASPNFVIQVGKVLTSNPSTGEILVSTLPFQAGATSIDSLRVHQNAEVIGLTASRALTTNGSKVLTSSATTATELGYVSGVTSAIQTQLNAKAPTASPTFTGTVSGITKTMVGLGNVDNTSNATERAATATLTNKRITKRTGSTTSSATPTINTDNVDYYSLTAQAADITSFTTNLSGTPTTGQQLRINVTGTAARAITWGASFANGPVALPTTTVTTTRLSNLFEYDGTVWRCMATGSTV